MNEIRKEPPKTITQFCPFFELLRSPQIRRAMPSKYRFTPLYGANNEGPVCSILQVDSVVHWYLF